MKFIVDTAHRDFFREHLWIEFEGFFSLEEVAKIQKEVQLSKKRRDLWRESPALRKLAIQSKLSDIAMDLTEAKAARVGFDQLLPEKGYQEGALEGISCLQGLLCGALICFQDGKVVFYDPTLSLKFPQEGEYLLVVYAQKRAVYIFQEKDPHAHFLKQLGYAFGDRLNSRLHPLVKCATRS